MTNHPRLRPVTRVRIAMESSPEVQAALSAFPHHKEDETFPLYTTAQRIMPYSEYHNPGESRRRDRVREAQALLVPALAQRALLLAEPAILRRTTDGKHLRIYFGPDKPIHLRQLTDTLKDVETIEPLAQTDALFAELAIGGLANEAGMRNAKEDLDAVLRGSYKSRKTRSAFATNAKIQVDDIANYPIRQ